MDRNDVTGVGGKKKKIFFAKNWSFLHTFYYNMDTKKCKLCYNIYIRTHSGILDGGVVCGINISGW